MQITWDLEEILISLRKVIPPSYEAIFPSYEAIFRGMEIFQSPRGMENYYISVERLFWQTRQPKSKTNTIIFFVKRLSKQRVLNQGPLDLQSDTLSTELLGLGRNCVNLLKFMFQKGKIKDNKIFCDTIKQDTGFEPGTLGSTVWLSINWAIRTW